MEQTYTTQEQLFERINHLKDGIYYIQSSQDKSTRQCKLLTEKLEDLPQAITLSSLEPYRYHIAKKMKNEWDEADSVITKINSKLNISKLLPIKKVLDIMFDVVAKGK